MEAKTPLQLGYRMPAEWRPHECTWLSWPKDPVTWPGRVPQVERVFLEMMALLAPHERVRLLVDNTETEARILKELRRMGVPPGRVAPHVLLTVDSWIRDYGPNFLIRESPAGSELAYNDWRFNAWGDKYEELKKDDRVPSDLERLLGMPRFTPGIVLEGGSIDVNGAGVCLTTEQCLLNPNRNPTLSRLQLEEYLREYLGASKTVWLGEGISGDDTDGHIDDIARFVAEDTVVCAVEEDPSDENYHLLRDNYRRLELAGDIQGRPFRVVPLPMPGPVETPDGRLPASYANFYIANQVVLVPVFGHENDIRAVRVLQGLFRDRRVVGIRCEALVWGLGAIHCVTQQQPAASRAA